MKKAVNKISNASNFEQRQYNNLDYLYTFAKEHSLTNIYLRFFQP